MGAQQEPRVQPWSCDDCGFYLSFCLAHIILYIYIPGRWGYKAECQSVVGGERGDGSLWWCCRFVSFVAFPRAHCVFLLKYLFGNKTQLFSPASSVTHNIITVLHVTTTTVIWSAMLIIVTFWHLKAARVNPHALGIDHVSCAAHSTGFQSEGQAMHMSALCKP